VTRRSLLLGVRRLVVFKPFITLGGPLGAWGVGPLDNDSAMDLAHEWKKFRTAGHDARDLTPEGSFNYFLEAGIGSTLDLGDADTMARLIALAELFHRDKVPIRGPVLEYFEEGINWELRPEALEEWDDPARRKKALQDLLARIGAKRRRITKPKLFRRPAVEFSSQPDLQQKLERWINAANAHDMSAFASDEEYPRFWQVLDRVMLSRAGGLGDEGHREAITQRLMLLAAYFGIYGLLPEDDAISLVRNMKGKYADIGHSTDTWKQYEVPNPPSDE
jgi:hypothetical protein